MFHKTKIALAAALAASISLAGFSVSGAFAADLEALNKSNWQDTLKQSDKPVLVLVTSAGCKPCEELEAVLKTTADSRGDVKFVKIDANDVGLLSEDLPYVAYSYPLVGITVSGVAKSLKTEAHINNALSVWSTSAIEVGKLKAKQAKLEETLDEAAAPYEKQLEQLSAKKKEATKGVYQDYNKVQGQLKAKAKPYDEQIAKIEAERDQALADLQQQAEKARDAIEAAKKPFNEEIAKLRETAAAAVSGTQTEMDKVRKAQLRLKNKDAELLDNNE